MKLLRNALVALGLAASATAAQAACHPKFINPVTDVCWTCIFPITVLGVSVTPDGVTRESGDSSSFFCTCSSPPMVGIRVSFWEPVRSVDVVREPFCFLNLGFQIGSGSTDTGTGTSGSILPYDVQGGVQIINNGSDEHTQEKSFYHVHFYTNPMLYWLELLLENPCIETGAFDLGYLTEADPTWVDPQLAGLLNPDAFLYGNILAVAACTADCISATTLGKPIDVMHWCSGCQGTVYPLTGHFNYHRDGVSTSSVLMQRMVTKAHRVGAGMAFGASGDEALCSYYPQFMIRKSDYKFQLTHPIPQDKRMTGKCCQPFGSSSALYGAGKNIPAIGEDFGYLLFRKRDCCAAAVNEATFSGGGN